MGRKKQAAQMAKNLLLGNDCRNCEKFMIFGGERLDRSDEGRCGIRKMDDLPDSRICKHWASDEWLREKKLHGVGLLV